MKGLKAAVKVGLDFSEVLSPASIFGPTGTTARVLPLRLRGRWHDRGAAGPLSGLPFLLSKRLVLRRFPPGLGSRRHRAPLPLDASLLPHQGAVGQLCHSPDFPGPSSDPILEGD